MKPIPVLFAVLLSASLVAQDGAARLEFAETGWDFGVRKQGERERKIIAIKNVGDADLVIDKIQVTCGCVSATLLGTDGPVPPGGSRELALDLDTTRQPAGRLRKHCYVSSNDPSRRIASLDIIGEIVGDWTVSTHNVNFGEIVAGNGARTSFDVVRTGERAVRLLRLEQSSNAVKVTMSAIPTDEHLVGWRVTIELMPDIAPGPFSAVIGVVTDHPTTPRENVMIHARVNGVLRLAPGRLFLGRVEPGVAKQGRATLSRADGRPLTITKVTAGDARVAASASSTDEGRTQILTIVVTAKEGDARIFGRVTVDVAGESQERIALDWEAICFKPD